MPLFSRLPVESHRMVATLWFPLRGRAFRSGDVTAPAMAMTSLGLLRIGLPGREGSQEVPIQGKLV
jgi:hypothetical protein